MRGGWNQYPCRKTQTRLKFTYCQTSNYCKVNLLARPQPVSNPSPGQDMVGPQRHVALDVLADPDLLSHVGVIGRGRIAIGVPTNFNESQVVGVCVTAIGALWCTVYTLL